MDQKHAMLYPDTSTIPAEQRSSAAAAIGLPVEPPPTYDAAVKEPSSSTTPLGWTTNTPDIHYPSTSTHYSPHVNHQHLPVITEQTNFPLPANQQQPNQSTITSQPSLSTGDGVAITSE